MDYNCWVCYDFFTEPITLHCEHSFCKKCIEKSSVIETLCPFCRAEYQLPLPPINKALNKRMLKLKGFDVVDTDPEDNNNNNNNNNQVNDNNNNNNNQVNDNNNNNNNNQVNDEVKPIPMDTRDDNIRYIAPDILHMPREIYVLIFNKISVKQLVEMQTISKAFQKIVNDNWIWKTKLHQHSQFSNPDKFNYDYRKCFIAYSKSENNTNKGAAGQFKMTAFRGHTQPITCFDHIGNIMTTGSIDNTIRIWDMNNKKGESILTLNGHSESVTCIKQTQLNITSGSQDGNINVWDIESGDVVSNFTHQSGIHSIAYHPLYEGKMMGASGDIVNIWDVKSKMKVQSFNRTPGLIRKSQFDPSGKLMISTDQHFDIWDLRSPLHPLHRFNAASVYDVTPTHLFAWNLGTLHKYNLVSGSSELSVPIHNVTGIKATSNDVAISSNAGASILDAKSLTFTHNIQNTSNSMINNILIDDKKLITASADNSIKVYDKNTGNKLYALLGGSNMVRAGEPTPLVAGCKEVRFDRTRVFGVFNHLIRVYNFRLE